MKAAHQEKLWLEAGMHPRELCKGSKNVVSAGNMFSNDDDSSCRVNNGTGESL